MLKTDWAVTQMSKMTEEEKAAQAAKEAEFQASLEGLSEEEKSKKLEERRIDLSKSNTEEALKLERQKREEAERKLEETRIKAKERFEKDNLGNELSREDVEGLIAEREDKLRKELRAEQAKDIAKTLTESPEEAELVYEVWRNRTLSGTLAEQLEEAHAIALSKRKMKENSELKRALAARDSEENYSLNPQRKPAPTSEPNINQTDKTVLTGYVWTPARNAYTKKIAGGTKTMFVSRDLKKRWVE